MLVADTCGNCPANRLVIPYSIFQQSFTNPSAGVATVRFRQAECSPPNPIILDVDTFRPTLGGYMRLALQSVAGSGAVASVEIRQAVGGVSCNY